MNNIINDRILQLRKIMEQNKIDLYFVPTCDYHDSEYVSDYFKEREFITGFTGSSGYAVITKLDALLWTDGRYFIQAEQELKDTCVKLMKIDEKDVPSLKEYLSKNKDNISCMAFDGKTVSSSLFKMFKESLNSNTLFLLDHDYINDIWTNRKELSHNNIFELDIKYTGLSRTDKLNLIKDNLNKLNATSYILTSLDDIAWLLNLRGSDVYCNPVFLSNLLIDKDTIYLYVMDNTIDNNLLSKLENDKIVVKNYFEIYNDVDYLDKDSVVLLNKNKINCLLVEKLSKYKLINELDFTSKLKAIKNDTEIKNAYKYHILDGLSLTKFIYYLKHNNNLCNETEISVADYLESLRKENEDFMGLSFPTIAGYKENGAIIHYEATPSSNKILNNESFILVDSGAQYLGSTTDVTRTISLGKLTDKEKKMYTLVLKSHLALGDAVFKEGTNGCKLDMLARDILWKNNLDYNHGTGHGVGSFLNVHEGPQNISNVALRSSYPFKEGMITSNEPGLYFENEFGIRIENLILSVKDKENEFGNFLKFDTLTLAPYDVEAIDQSMLTKKEVELIHSYHERIYNTFKPFLKDDELKWLKSVVDAI